MGVFLRPSDLAQKKFKVAKALLSMGYFNSYKPRWSKAVHRFSREENAQKFHNIISTASVFKTRFLDTFWVHLKNKIPRGSLDQTKTKSRDIRQTSDIRLVTEIYF